MSGRSRQYEKSRTGRSGRSGRSRRSEHLPGVSVRPEVPGCLEDLIDSENLEVSLGCLENQGVRRFQKVTDCFSDSRASLTPQSRQRAKK